MGRPRKKKRRSEGPVPQQRVPGRLLVSLRPARSRCRGCAGDGAARWAADGVSAAHVPGGATAGEGRFPGGARVRCRCGSWDGIGGTVPAKGALVAEMARMGAPAVEIAIILKEGRPLLLSERSARDGGCCQAVSGCCIRVKCMAGSSGQLRWETGLKVMSSTGADGCFNLGIRLGTGAWAAAAVAAAAALSASSLPGLSRTRSVSYRLRTRRCFTASWFTATREIT